MLDALEEPHRANLHLASRSSDRHKEISALQFECSRLLGLLDLSRLRYADLAAYQLAVARRPPVERAEAVARVTAEADQLRQRDTILAHFITPYGRAIDSDIATAAHLLVARIALAVERARLETGEVPARLEEGAVR